MKYDSKHYKNGYGKESFLSKKYNVIGISLKTMCKV